MTGRSIFVSECLISVSRWSCNTCSSQSIVVNMVVTRRFLGDENPGSRSRERRHALSPLLGPHSACGSSSAANPTPSRPASTAPVSISSTNNTNLYALLKHARFTRQQLPRFSRNPLIPPPLHNPLLQLLPRQPVPDQPHRNPQTLHLQIRPLVIEEQHLAKRYPRPLR